MGSGRLEELIIRALRLQADFIIVDRNLTPAQARAIAEAYYQSREALGFPLLAAGASGHG